MVPKGRYGGIMQTPYQRRPMVLKAQQGSDLERMMPLKAQVTSPQLQSQLNTNTLDPMAATTASGGGLPSSVIAGGANMAANLGVAAIDSFSDTETDAYGITAPESSEAAVGKGALKGAATGAAVGSVVPVVGTAIGAAAGAVLGGATSFLTNNKEQKEYEEAFTKAKHKNTRSQDADLFKSMMAKDGAKFGRRISKIVSGNTTLTPVFKSGGKLHGDKNVITKGKLHKENNNLGNKDKGIPVIDAQGNKEYELEKEEWVVTADVTKQLETMASKYKSSNNDDDLESLGRFVHKQFLSNTQDNSRRFGIGEKK